MQDKDKIQLNNISKADLKIIGLKIEVKEKKDACYFPLNQIKKIKGRL